MKKLAAVAILLASFATGPAFAQAADDLADLVGARAAVGETQLEARGYVFVTTNTVRDTKWSFWSSDRTHRCVEVATADGRYTAINRVPEDNCRSVSDNSDDRRPANSRRDGPDSRSDVLILVCFGQGSALANQSYSGYRYNSKTRSYEPEFGNTLGREGFASDVQVEISQGRGRIHLTGELVSPIHSGGADNWWPIDNLVVTPDRITGSYRMNGFNKPRLDIDRRAGTISINAVTNFSGRCDAGNPHSGF
jgi:hypothetical protein